MVDCPICGKSVTESNINLHLDSGCEAFVEAPPSSASVQLNSKSPQVSSFFKTSSARKPAALISSHPQNPTSALSNDTQIAKAIKSPPANQSATKRRAESQLVESESQPPSFELEGDIEGEPPAKRPKPSTALQKAAPLAERMRPRTLDHVYGQDLVGPGGVLRGLIEADRVPSMILWGGTGTGKTTIARVIANMVGSRFVEINSTSSGVGECKKIFTEARGELGLNGRKTIIFCDEIHRFSKSQQDVFLGSHSENPERRYSSLIYRQQGQSKAVKLY